MAMCRYISYKGKSWILEDDVNFHLNSQSKKTCKPFILGTPLSTECQQGRDLAQYINSLMTVYPENE